MLPRLLTLVVLSIVVAILAKIICYGVVVDKNNPISGWRKTLVHGLIVVGSSLLLRVFSFTTEMKEQEMDFSFYLG